jgi:hypothetical protein
MNKIRSLLTFALLTLAAHADSVTISWQPNPPDDQASYLVYQATNVAGPFAVTSATPDIQVTLTNLSEKAYFWFVTATNLWGESDHSDMISTPNGVPRGAMLALTQASPSVILQWFVPNPADQQILQYHIWQQSGTTNWTQIGTSLVSGFSVPNLPTGKYCFAVTAENFWGQGPQSNVTCTPTSKPSKVVGVVIVKVQ